MDNYLLDGHKLFWHMDRILAWQQNRMIPPIYVEISPVSYCNHRCIFCGTDFAMQKAVQLDTEILCKRLKEMASLGVRSIMYAGEGEPLLHSDLSALVNVSKSIGIDVAITTNGALGTEPLWKEILPPLSWVKFSVDAGSPSVYSRVHQVPEKAFDKTLDSIDKAIKVKKDHSLNVTLGVQFLLIEENVDDLENAVQLFSQSDIDYLVIKPYSLHPQMIKEKEVSYSEETVRNVQEVVDRYQGKTNVNLIFRKGTMEKYIQREKHYHHCYALPFWGYLSSRGDFYTCSVFLGEERLKAGNIYERSTHDILMGGDRRKAIEFGEKDLNIGEVCRLNCRMARINEFLEYLEKRPEHVNFI